MKKISFDELLAKKEQREADKLRIGEIPIPGSDTALAAKMPGQKTVLDLFGEFLKASDPAEVLACGKHALYSCCPQLQDRALQAELGVSDDPMQIVDTLFTLPEQDALGGAAFRFLGLIPSDKTAGTSDEDAAETGAELVAFYAVRGVPLDTLAASSPAAIALLDGARALYYEEQVALIQTALAGLLPGGDADGD